MRTLLLAALCLPLAAQTPGGPGDGPLGNLRQLTHGGQNAEAYWSPDGTKLVFQSTRDGLECDQIFTMNADGTDVRMVSTGKGATTCGYFLADNRGIVFASTHHYGDACPARPDRSQGYVWAVHPTFDIFLTDVTGAAPRRLTDAGGYDAEATVNWKTNRIVYTSKSSGDLELWSMNPDGSRKRQLTAATGYDGGAFFSRDGERIVMRAHHPATDEGRAKYLDLLGRDLTAPMKMELFVGERAGSDWRWRQVTDFGCASFAPEFTPDGQRVVFASNRHKCDSREFELYMMDADGSNLRQITHFGGFTSFAQFSPDGRRVVFTSSYGAKSPYEFNIFVADWTE